MVTTDPQAVAWSVALRSAGRVEVDARRGRLTVYWLLSAVFVAVGVLGLVTASGTGARVFCALLVMLFGSGAALFTAQLVGIGSWRSPLVLVDSDGLTVRHGYLRVPWSDLLGATAYVANHNSWVTVGMSEQAYDAWLARRSWVLRVLARRRRSRRYGMLNLPPNLAVDAEAFAQWLTDEASERRLTEIRQLRRDLDAGVLEAERLAAKTGEHGT